MKKILFSLLVLLATTASAADQITLPSFIQLQTTDTIQTVVDEITFIEDGDQTKLCINEQEFILPMEYPDAVCWYLNIQYAALKLGYISKKQFRHLERIYKQNY
jgi:hypothetical protein